MIQESVGDVEAGRTLGSEDQRASRVTGSGKSTIERKVQINCCYALEIRKPARHPAFGGSSSEAEKASSTFFVMRDTLLS